MNKAIFFDRDGVINTEINYLYKIDDFEFIDGVFETCKHFQEKNYLIFIITNQSGIARKKYTEKQYDILTTWMQQSFNKRGITISKTYHCPHHPEFSTECSCRKPKPGMIIQAKNEFNINLKKSILIGDKNSDIEAGINAGISTNYLISTGHLIKKNPHGVPIINNLTDLISHT